MIEHGARVLPNPAEVVPDDGRPIAVTVRLVQRRIGMGEDSEVALVGFG